MGWWSRLGPRTSSRRISPVVVLMTLSSKHWTSSRTKVPAWARPTPMWWKGWRRVTAPARSSCRYGPGRGCHGSDPCRASVGTRGVRGGRRASVRKRPVTPVVIAAAPVQKAWSWIRLADWGDGRAATVTPVGLLGLLISAASSSCSSYAEPATPHPATRASARAPPAGRH